MWGDETGVSDVGEISGGLVPLPRHMDSRRPCVYIDVTTEPVDTVYQDADETFTGNPPSKRKEKGEGKRQ